MARLIPAGFQFWGEQNAPLTPDQIQKAYDNKFVGAWKDPEEEDRLKDSVRAQGYSFEFAAIAHQYNYADQFAGKLVIPFRLVEYIFPGCWPGAAQQVGDCVSHDRKNACLTTFAYEIAMAKPDEVSGIVEMAPEIPAQGIQQGAMSSESIYWWRGYNGHGWSCSTAARVVLEHGILLRKPYPELSLDLTTYSGSKASMYGARSPTAAIDAETKLHGFRTVAAARSFAEIRDALGVGGGVSSCGGEGYSSTRDANGVSRRSGSWAHAMAIIGADDRTSTISLYGEPLILIINSWGLWNGGPRRIRGTNVDIPEGSFWVRWSEAKNRDYHVTSGAKGWQRGKLDPFHLGIAT